nr:hypothetical protein [Tanacetum cinerariifolium]
MEMNKSFDVADYKRDLYNALVKSYNTDKCIFESYDEVFSLKRSRDNKDKDQDPSVGSNQGTKRKKSNIDVVSSRDSRSKEKKFSSTSKDASQTKDKSSKKSTHAEEPSHTIEDSGMQQDQEFITGDNDEQPADKETWISQVARAEEPPTSFDELNDTSFDFSTFVINRLQIPDLTQEIMVGLAFNLLKGTCKSITELDYHLEECSKATTERLDWHNPKNKPNKTAYTSHSDPHGIIYVDQFKRKQLMHTDELYKFSDDTLNDVQTALHDIVVEIRMEYLPMRKWSKLEKKRARVMVQDIDKQLYQRRLIRNLEKFVGERIYENDLRLLERTI